MNARVSYSSLDQVCFVGNKNGITLGTLKFTITP